MLELTRRIGESVDIGSNTKVTLIAMLPTQVQIIVEEGDKQQVVHLASGGVHRHIVDGMRVQIQLLSIVRGIARFGYLAPRSLEIHRSEKVNR